MSDVSCIYCNFPWGENIKEYFRETEEILGQISRHGRSGTVCAFITSSILSEELLSSLRFRIDQVINLGDERKVKDCKKVTFVTLLK